MARNVEIKARIESVEAMWPRVVAIADSGPTEIFQDDTFFRCETGRLKLREFTDGRGELIFYRRPSAQGPKESFYLISPVSALGSMRELLALSCGLDGRVEKHRSLFLVGRSRIHLDRVKGLGDFLELEVVLRDGESTESGVAEASVLMARLGIPQESLIDSAYVDLLSEKRTTC
jgi:adenylate cyclase